jgi:hypothetical protein
MMTDNDDRVPSPILRELVPGLLWVREHPVRLAGGRFLTRMTVLRLDDGLCLHSPVEIDAATRSAIEGLGHVSAIIAPSTVHHFFVASAQQAFPSARTYAVKGLEAKRKDLRFDEFLDDEPPALWAGQMDQVIVGNRVMREVDFLHRASRTLIAVDLVENFRDETPGTNAVLRAYMRLCGMWGRPRPAPELRWLTRDRQAARLALERILAWDFDRAVIAHGELLDRDPHESIREAWGWVLAP